MNRLTLLDTLRLRDTTVYAQPATISPLQVVYGDLSNTRIPCLKLNSSGTIYHISDFPITSIDSVYVGGEPAMSGWTGHISYMDETGKAISVIVFDNPQYEKAVCCSCKGVITEDGLITNPALIIRHILINVQGYDDRSIDTDRLSEFEAVCRRHDLHIAVLLDKKEKLKQTLDRIASNIGAVWTLSDGKFVVRLL